MDKRQILAVFLIAIMIPLSGCISDGVDGEQGEQGEQGIQGPSGTNGTDGHDGIDGSNGVNGSDGQDGVDGIDGNSAMISTFDVSPGIHCENGGIGLLVGIDENGNGMLTSNEVQETTFVCNGVDGSQNPNSGSSSSGLLSRVATLGHSDGCPAGGKLMMFGVDDGDNGGVANNGVLESGEIDNQTTYCSTQRISRVTDIAPGALFSNPGGPRNNGDTGMQIVVGNTLYFSAYDDVHGVELWAYDMITDSVYLVADINPGQDASYPGYWLVLEHENIIYFDATDLAHGRELWAHNTINGSTWLVANLNDDEYGSNTGEDMAVVYGDTLYFSAFTIQYATELWAHRPANNSTWLVEDIHHGSSSNPGWFMHFVYNDVLYFTARDMMNVHDLWGHNQSNGSTWKVASFGMAPWTNPGNSFEYLIGDVLYFDADNDLNGRELMAYNLKTDTYWVAADIVPGQTSSNPGINLSILVDDTIYFETENQILYAHSTTNHTTWMIHQFTDASPQSTVKPVIIGSEFFFKIEDESSHLELWVYNTENHSTWMIKRFIPPATANSLDIGIIENVNGILYFDAITEEYGRELWAHNPMDESTWHVANIHKANATSGSPDGSSTPGFTLSLVHNGYYFFSATDGQYGNELWKMWFENTITYE